MRLDAVQQGLALGVGGGPGVERLLPGGAGLGGALREAAGALQHVVRDDEGLLRVEPEDLLGGGELVGAERRAVDLAAVLLAGCRPADDGLEDDERRLVGLALGGLDRGVELGDVLDVFAGLLPVHGLHVPAVGLVAGGHVLGEGDVGVVLDRDLVGVVDRDEVAELLVTGERGGLAGDALLQVAVACDHVDEVVERARARRGLRVEEAALVAGGVGEAHRGGEALAQRTRGDLDALGVAVLGMAGRLRTPRAERLEVVELEAEPTEVELHILRQRRVADREDEAVAAEPVGVGRVMPQHTLVQQIGGGGQTHRRAGMTVADLFDRIGRQDPGGVHRASIDLVPLQFRHVHALSDSFEGAGIPWRIRNFLAHPASSGDGRVCAQHRARECSQHSGDGPGGRGPEGAEGVTACHTLERLSGNARGGGDRDLDDV